MSENEKNAVFRVLELVVFVCVATLKKVPSGFIPTGVVKAVSEADDLVKRLKKGELA